MSRRISHSLLDPHVGPVCKRVYSRLHIPARFPPEGIVAIGHVSAIVGAIGFAYSTTLWWAGLVAAAGVLGNHFADCIDGTHARATGQCRNGGELLDHFTDPLSFAYVLIGIAVGCGRLGWGLAAVCCLFAFAVLTNIKAKMVGDFELAAFGPTEMKATLVGLGVIVAVIAISPASGATASFVMSAALVIAVPIGIAKLGIELKRTVKQVNASEKQPDTSEWINTAA